DILDDEFNKRTSSGWIVKVIAFLLILTIVIRTISIWNIYTTSPIEINLKVHIPMLLIDLIAGIGLLANKRFGWFAGVLSLSLHVGHQANSFIEYTQSSRYNLSTGFISLIAILFVVLLLLALYRKKTTTFFEINKNSQVAVLLGAVTLAVLSFRYLT
ncbi:MAG: hypothetical protein AAF598_17680, partial [Bacteroidota bacterium]